MKKRFVSLLVALSITLTFLPMGAVAATKITKGNLKYTVNADGKSVTVSGTSGKPTQLTIESSISYKDKNYTVTKIATWAFNACNTLTEVTLPNTVDEIGYQAFFKCSNLTKVIIPEGVTKIGQAAFYGCSQLTSITIPGTVTEMDSAFSGSTALSQVTLTNGIPKISSHAFERCTELREIKVPISVDEICSDAFNGCTGLTSVTLEKGINIINSNAFKDCTELNDVKYNGHKTDWENVRVNIAGNDTLTSKVQYLCDINFDLNGGTINGSNTVNKQTVYSNEKLGTAKCYPNGQPFVVPSDPVREGYTFLGWYTQAEGGTKYTFTEAVSSNIILYAHWNAHSHTVTLKNDENKETNSYDYGSSVSVPTPTKKTGYNFNHWEVTVPDGETFGAGNYLVLSLENDTGKDKGATPANLYVADITFKDASGNVLAADTSAEYVAADTGSDRSNLCALTDVVEFEGFAVSGDGWCQAGFTMPQEILDALVPGSVVEITYSSENGDMWVVMNEAAAGWMRVGQGNADGSGSDSAYINNSKTTAQITFEQIAALCSDDVSTWGTTMQCEASGAWEVYSVAVGQSAE